MNREVHVRFWEGVGVKFSRATQLCERPESFHFAVAMLDEDLPLLVPATRVWQALREIPAGSTATYSEIANRIGSPKSVRAVAQVCGANALAVAIPCHRVVRNDGAVTGYRWRVERKRALLDKEARV